MQDVVADAGVHRHRNRNAISRCQHAQVAVREIALLDAPPGVFAKSEAEAGRLRDPFVQLAGLAPESELAGSNVAGHALGRGPDPRQFVIVDGPRAVHGYVVDETALQKIDDMPADTRAEQVAAHHQDSRSAVFPGLDQPPGDLRQIRI